MVPPYSEIWLAANLRNGWRAAAAGSRTGRKKAHRDTAVGMEVCKNVDAGGEGDDLRIDATNQLVLCLRMDK